MIGGAGSELIVGYLGPLLRFSTEYMDIRDSLIWNGFLSKSQKEERGGGRTALLLYATRFAIPSIRADIALESLDFFLQVWQVVADCNSQCFAALKNHTNQRFGGLRLFKFAGLLIVRIAVCWKNVHELYVLALFLRFMMIRLSGTPCLLNYTCCQCRLWNDRIYKTCRVPSCVCRLDYS